MDHHRVEEKNDQFVRFDIYASRHVLSSDFLYYSSFSHMRRHKHSTYTDTSKVPSVVERMSIMRLISLTIITSIVHDYGFITSNHIF